MKIYLAALSVGLLVGVIYGLLNVRSPAPPVVALVGLLGILLGEQAVPLARRLLAGEGLALSQVRHACSEQMFAALPSASSASPPDTAAKS